MKNQFFYTRREVSGGTPEAPEYKEFRDSFNVSKVIRSITLEDGRILVLFDDMHERAQEVPDVDPKTKRMKGMKRERNMYQTEIFLDASDAERFFQLTSV